MKKGDKVICVDNEDFKNILKLKDEYTVHKVQDEEGVIEVSEIHGLVFAQSKFKLIKKLKEPIYMMFWDDNERYAAKKEFVADLRENPRFVGTEACWSLDVFYKNCKPIDQWKEDTGFLFENTLNEMFFKGDTVYWVSKGTNELNSELIDNFYEESFADSEDDTEFMTKESAEKYVKEHEVKYRPFTQAEFRGHRDRWFNHIQGSTSGYRITKTESDYVYVSGSKCTYQDLLDSYVFEDGTPCGIQINK